VFTRTHFYFHIKFVNYSSIVALPGVFVFVVVVVVVVVVVEAEAEAEPDKTRNLLVVLILSFPRNNK